MNTASLTHCYEINLQPGMGGGEVYTRFFTEALAQLGCQITLIVKRSSWLAANLRMAGVNIVEVDKLDDVPGTLVDDQAVVFSHHPLSGPVADAIRQVHRLIYFAHMPLYGRDPTPFRTCDLILAVSRHVIDSLRATGINHYYPEPLYGVADLQRGNDGETEIHAGPIYDWDRRKFRDRLLGVFYPLIRWAQYKKTYHKKPGLTVGIVSRLTPIKQFPQLFTHLAPILVRHPHFNLEIFGSGGYASVRDLRRALRPISSRVRYWGHQQDVRRIYASLDFLFAGLPEKEALGLNVLEAQTCGLPVIAVNAPPFTETVLNGETGYLFTDPRLDGGRSFDELLSQLGAGARPTPGPTAQHHLLQFSFEAFRARIQILPEYLATKSGADQS